MATRTKDDLEIREVLDSQIRCPACRFGTLTHESLYKWKCITCGYWTVRTPTVAQQGTRQQDGGEQPPLTSDQKEALRSGREQWKTLVRLGGKAALGFLTIFTTLSLGFNLALWAALQASLSISWTIVAWVASVFLGLLGLIMFYISSTRRKVVFGLVFGLTLALFIFTLGA